MTTPSAPSAASSPSMPPVGAPSSPKSKLSSATLLVLVVVTVLVLGGIGVLVAEGVKSEPTPTKPPPVASPNGATTGGAGRSARSAAPSGNAGSKGTKAKTVTTVKLAGGAATQPVPSGWTSKAGDSGNSVVVYKAGFFVYTEVAKSDAEATAQVNGMLTAWVVDDDHYSQIRVSDPSTLDAADPFSSGANIGYVALYTSNGGSSSVYGVLIAFVRTDGLVLRMQLEAFSATSTDDALARFKAEKTDIAKLVTVIDSFAQSAT
jgi:hypothetical protein